MTSRMHLAWSLEIFFSNCWNLKEIHSILGISWSFFFIMKYVNLHNRTVTISNYPESWEVYIYKGFVKTPPLWGPPGWGICPFACSLNPERLFKSYGSFHYKIPHMTEPITSTMHFSSFTLQLSAASGTRAIHSSRYFCCSCYPGHRQTHKKKNLKKKRIKRERDQVNSWLACSASTQAFTRLLYSCLSAQQCKSAGQDLGGSQRHLAAQQPTGPRKPCVRRAAVARPATAALAGEWEAWGHGSTWNLAVLKSTFCYKDRTYSSQIF